MSRASKALAHLFAGLTLATILPIITLLLSPRRAAPANKIQEQPQSSALKPELQPLSYFIGQWNCSGEFPTSHKPISSRISISSDLDGYWLAFRWDDNPPSQFHALELWGFDKAAKQFTNSIYDNFSGMRIFHSSGWTGDELTWGPRDLPPNSPIVSERFVFDRKSAKEFVISWEVRRTQAQQWTVGDRLTCQQQ